jgi:hypothetical protein
MTARTASLLGIFAEAPGRLASKFGPTPLIRADEVIE